jgi:acyl-CoA synthetase (NDP forming)
MRRRINIMTNLFFYPKTIAVIGATSNTKKFGNAVTQNILKNKNLQSELFLISKGSREIYGINTYESILNIPKEIDLAIILVPEKIVDQIIDECIQKKVKRIIIVTSGFGEINEEGKRKEKLIAMKCKESGIRVMGPNCVGIQNLEIGLNASFIQAPKRGNISIISQSGSIGCASFYAMERYNLGCSKFANIGNAIDISFNEILEYYEKDIDSQIIALYLETIKDGINFLSNMKRVNKSKPVIVLKGGRTEKGMKAASSHTGSITTNYKILKAAIMQSGAILCENMPNFITALKTLSLLPIPEGENMGVLTNSGGSAVLFSDVAEIFNLKLVEFSEDLISKISPYVIPLVKKINPLDMIASAGEEQYYQITKAMLQDPNIAIVVACCVIPPFLEMKTSEHYKGVVKAWNETNRRKPIIPLFLFSEDFKELHELANKEKIPIFYSPNEAAFAIKILIDRMRFLQRSSKY